MSTSVPEQRSAAEIAATVGAAYAASRAAPGAPTPPVGKAAVGAGIVALVVGFLAAQRLRQEAWLRQRLGDRLAGERGGIPAPEVVARIIAEEQSREAEFARKQTERLMGDVAAALALPSQTEREDAMRRVMAREQTYVRQRSMAMAARAFAAVDRVVLKEQSPTGALWELDPDVREHTAACLYLGAPGRNFWPWAVLDRVHPPRHGGCPCKLRSYGEAVARGLLNPGDVLDVSDAVRRAAHIVMEAEEPECEYDRALMDDLLREAQAFEVEEAAVAAGLVNAEAARAAHERWDAGHAG